eukprot:1194980-Prorocentrum_minimum.AAC.2
MRLRRPTFNLAHVSPKALGLSTMKYTRGGVASDGMLDSTLCRLLDVYNKSINPLQRALQVVLLCYLSWEFGYVFFLAPERGTKLVADITESYIIFANVCSTLCTGGHGCASN